MVKPTMRYFQDVLRITTCSDRHKARLVVWHKLNIYWDAAFVDEFTPKPFIKDVFNWMTFTSVFHTDTNRMGISQKALK